LAYYFFFLLFLFVFSIESYGGLSYNIIHSSNENKRYPNINKLTIYLIAVTIMCSNTFILHLKIGIIKDLYANGLITLKQMEQAIKILRKIKKEE